jgi:RNA polymerase sigma factor (sigma-70 family)
MTVKSDMGLSKQAFEDLYEGVAQRLLWFVVRRMQDPEAAAEVWSECWAVAFEGWSRCRARSISEREAWMFGIARNQLAGYYRSGAIERRALTRLGWAMPLLDRQSLEEIERVAELDELRATLSGPLAELPSKRRLAVQLRIVEGLSYSDVAARMGCSEDSARAQVSRGLRALAKAIDREAKPRPEHEAI